MIILSPDLIITMSFQESDERLQSLKSTVLPSLIRYRKLVETSLDGISVTDSEGFIVITNKQNALLLGFQSINDVIGKSVYDFVSSKDLQRMHIDVKKILEHGSIRDEYEFISRNGSIVPIELSISVISNMKQEPTNYMFISRNINERKRAEEMEKELQEKRRLAALGQLAAGVAHELNTPLVNISLTIEIMTNLIKRNDLNPNQLLNHLTVLEKQTDFCGLIVKNLLQFSREITISPINFNAKALFMEIVSYPSITMKLVEKNAKIILEVDENVKIDGDEGLLLQVFQNIILNSIDATNLSEKESLIIISLIKHEKFVEITVTDDGEGITEENLSKIFEPFFSTKGIGKGTGLGLSITKGIIEKHNGQIVVNSTPGKGTEVKVTLPRKKNKQ